MIIKDKKEFKLNLLQIFTGCPDKTYVGAFLFPTVVITLIGIIINTLFFVSSETTNELYLDHLLHGLIIFAGIGLGLALLSLIAYNDWIYYGKNIWFRVVLYNLILLTVSAYLSSNSNGDKIIEPVTNLIFVKSDAKRCENAVRMTSNQMAYTYCETSESSFNKMKETKDLKINLIGVKKYGTIIPLNMEIVEKTVIIK